MSKYHSGSFTSGYEEFWRKSTDEIDNAIKSSTIVLDTNAVLNLYRMKPSARGEYLTVLTKISSRTWIPRRVADEFHDNRLSSVASHVSSLKKKSQAVSAAADEFRSSLRDFYKLHSLADGRANEHLKPLNAEISRITEVIENEVKGFDLTPEKLIANDPILERLAILFDERVGDDFSSEMMEEIKKEAIKRGGNKVPPGYIDVQRKGEEGIGDYVIWRQMLEKAKSSGENMLFVSTDTKEDWARIQCGLSVGPRPELVREMKGVGVSYHQLPLAAFLSRAARVLSVRVSQDTLDQVNVRVSQDERQRQRYIRNRRTHAVAERLVHAEEELSQMRSTLKEAEKAQVTAEERVRFLNSSLEQARYERDANPNNADHRVVENLLIDLDVAKFEQQKSLAAINSLRRLIDALMVRQERHRKELSKSDEDSV
ncbi:PIN-like domain-containing protein [Streptomyces globisporus]|uniref:PIN-like domain-containing protein n=1 Tax=Streptomyces TaxID=1883 RepID=UPI00116147D2|nr:PIN-like domain-containing protein [Streptomyces sp. TSRI0445]